MEMQKTVPSICSRCEALPERAEGPGVLYLWFPLGHSLAKVVPFFMALESKHEVLWEDACVVVTLAESDRDRLVTGLAGIMSPEERRDTKALFMREQKAHLTPGDFAGITPLENFLKAQEANWLIDMLATERFTSHFQPIVHAKDPSKIFAHEALFRGLDENGAIIPPNKVFGLAREAGMLFQMDLQARRSAIRRAAAHQMQSALFINFNPSSIYDPAFCLRSTLRAIDESGLPRDRVVFEVVESDNVENQDHLAAILNHYREMGFRVALDDLGAGYSSLGMLSQLRPDFVKLDMGLIRDVDGDPYKGVIVSRLLELSHDLGIEVIAEGVETNSELAWLQAHGADYIQGYLTGRPQAAPLTAAVV